MLIYIYNKIQTKLSSIDWKFYWKNGLLRVGKIDKDSYFKIVELTKPENQAYLANIYKKIVISRTLQNALELIRLFLYLMLIYSIIFRGVKEYITVFIVNIIFYGINMAIANYMQDFLYLHQSLISSSLSAYITERNAGSEIYSKKNNLRMYIKYFCQMERFPHIWFIFTIALVLFVYFLNKWYELPYLVTFAIFITLSFSHFFYISIMDGLYRKWQTIYKNVDQYLQNNILQKVSKSSSYPNITIKHANMPKMTFAKVFANVYANIFIILMISR